MTRLIRVSEPGKLELRDSIASYLRSQVVNALPVLVTGIPEPQPLELSGLDHNGVLNTLRVACALLSGPASPFLRYAALEHREMALRELRKRSGWSGDPGLTPAAPEKARQL